MKFWWDSWPERLEHEEDALRKEGFVVERDMEAFGRGFVRLHVLLPDGYWITRRLRADFPDSYPYTRPVVYAPDLTLEHHQNPIDKNLCLLERSSQNWSPTWTLARLLKEQLPELSRALQLTEINELREVEVEQGEPLTEFLPYEPESVIIIDSSWTLPPASVGLLELTRLTPTDMPLRGFVNTLTDIKANLIANGHFGVRDGEPIVGAWINLNDRPTLLDPAALFESLRGQYPQLRRTPARGGVQVVGVAFPDELGHRTLGLGWAFIVRRETVKKGGRHHVTTSFVRAARAGTEDLAARLPEFRSLQQCGVAVFGLGCLGAPSALDFARAGIRRLHALDHDVVEAGTVVRWPFGLTAAHRSKAQVICNTILRDYPWVDVVGSSHQVGRPNQQPLEREVIELMLKDVDLVYDASAEIGVQQFVSSVARERKIPYICISATQGGRGGIVARFNHRASGCWFCFLTAMENGQIPNPEADDGPGVQPAGCNRRTYTGANFDIAEVALQGVRLAMVTLLSRQGASMDCDFPWDVATVNLRDSSGRRIAPQWTTHTLECNSNCPVCGH